mgnify:FL=1
MTTSSSSQKKKTQVVADLIPNNYEEQPGLIEGKTKVFKDKVAARVDDLDNLGKFVTLFQYVLILVVILVLVLSRIFKGTTIAYTELKPSYSKYLEMRSDPDVLNMKCSVTNDTLTYDAFTTYSYKKADACEWVKADLAKSAVLKTENEYFLYDDDGTSPTGKIIRRDLLGKTSACKTLKKTDSCEAINEDCARGHALVEQLLSNMKIANFPLKELLDSESKLLTFVNSTLTQSLQSLLSGLEGPRIAVKQWASKNMPVLYGYLGSMQSYVQGQAFRNGDSTSNFYKRVQAACTVYNKVIAEDGYTCDIQSIGDGDCSPDCDNAYCLYDGGDCLTGGDIFAGNSNGKWTYNDENGFEFKYQAFSPLQQGDELFENPYYDTSDASIYTDAVINELKLLKDAENVLLFDSDNNGTVTDEELEGSSIFSGLSSHPIWQSLPNNFVGFDPNNTCGNPSTWYKSYELNRPESWFTDLKNFNKDFFELLKEKLYPTLGYPSGVSVPTGDVPTQSTDVFSCDALSQSHNLPGIVGVTSTEIKVWVDYTYAVFQYFKDKCVAGANAGEWATSCLDMGTLDASDYGYDNLQFPAGVLSITDPVYLLSLLEYSYLGATARENSGSVEQLLLDAGIKRDAKGYNIEANVDHETYFKVSDVSECSYSKRVGASPATVVTVVLGLIGGVTTTVSVFAVVLYQLFRKRVFKKYKNEMQSKDPSSSVPV